VTEMDSHVLFLDVTDRIILSRQIASRFQNDLNARESLWAGLELLHAQTRLIEQRLVPVDLKDSISVSWGNIPGVPIHVLRQVACFFDWYSVSACNFVSITGWLAHTCKITTEGDLNYRRRVAPEILAHRNKIGAHAARVWPKDDGIATQEASNFRQLALVNDRFFANYMMLSRHASGQSSNSRALPAWSLTEMHEKLRKRYVVEPIVEDQC
jgi:hypothetical protein